MKVTLGYSPCPNDTYIFHAIADGLLDVAGYAFEVSLHDVETLNQMAFEAVFDITKLSFYAWLKVKKNYRLLKSGSALGHGCGPILVSKTKMEEKTIHLKRIVLPGEWTTAHLLFQLWAPLAKNKRFVPYDEILPMLESGEADAGVIIHESRFTFESLGFLPVIDLGAFWEKETGLPIPLGCIAIRKDLPEKFVDQFEIAIVKSIEMAKQDPQRAMPYIRKHAKEMDPETLSRHIETFVNDYSLDLGEKGEKAVYTLEQMARSKGVLV